MMDCLGQTLRKVLLVSVFLVTFNAYGAESAVTENIRILLEKVSVKELHVKYVLGRATRSLHMRATPDQSRSRFWHASSDEFELIQIDGVDIIRRVDGELFQTAKFTIDIVDISLPKYYRPFSPMFESKDGLVVHTGQYFVCMDVCKNAPTTWQLEITAKDQNIIHHQSRTVSRATWQDSGDGRSFYIGPKKPIVSESLVAVIDSGLPDKLTRILDANLPFVIDELGTKFEAPKSKPLLFATYNRGDPERSGFQGGVLSKTVTMHWWGLNLAERISESDELWFIVHEISHFYQSQESDVDNDEVAWIHEGFAELMAAKLIANSNEEMRDYVTSRYQAAKEVCEKGLETIPLGKANQLKKFDLHYKCGMLLHRFVSANANVELSVFELWNRYRAAINTGKPPSKQTYLDVVKEILPREKFLVLHTIVQKELAPKEVVTKLLEGSDF